MRCALAALALAVVLPLPVFADITVKSGETLSEIAERHGVGLEPLMRVNGIQDPDLVRAGQRLVLPGGSRKGGAGGDGTSVIVQTGDTLSEIAERNGISLQKLMQLNGITDPSLVQAGRRLVIRSGGGSGRSTSPTSSGSGSYTVASGETLGEIAERLNTSVNRLMQLNGISDPTLLQAGSRLIVPGARSSSNSRAGSREHVVQEGETLSEIAAANNINVQKLAALNSISDPDLVRSGTRLRLSAPPVPRASRPAPRPAKATAQPKPKPTPKQTPKPAAVATQPTPANSAAPASPVKASNPATRSTTPGATVSAAAALSTTNNAAPAAPTTTAKPEADKPAVTQKPEATKPAVTAAKPAVTQKPEATKPAVTAAKPAVTRKPEATKPAVTAAKPAVTRKPEATKPAVTAAKPAVTQKPEATKPAVTAAKPAVTQKGESPDWRTYGPLQVDWAKWQSMGGSYVAPSLNASGQLHYTAINCGARKMNATSPAGQWKTWEQPSTDAEQKLVSDLCKAKGS